MANSTLKPDVITKEALVILHNNLTFCRNVNRQYDNSNEMNGQKNGGAIRIRLPNQYLTSTGAALSVQDTVERKVDLPAGTQRHVDTNFTTKELTLDIDTFSKRILEPGISTLASVMDWDVYSARSVEVGNSVGTPGTTPATARVLLDAHTKLSNSATPLSMRNCMVNPEANASLVDGLKGLFHSTSALDGQFKSGLMGNNILGYRDFSMSQSVGAFTTGTRLLTDTLLVDEGGGVAEGDTTLDVDGVSGTETLKKGDVFTVAGVYSVNPETKVSTGQLYQFVVAADVTAAGNQWTITVGSAMYASATDARKNMSALPADGAAVTFIGSPNTDYAQNMAFHEDAFILATTDLEMPEGVHFSAREVMDGVSMRLVRQYRIGTDDIPTRIDILYGSVTARPEMACRIWG